MRSRMPLTSISSSAAYGITDKGNWEGRTVLQRALDDCQPGRPLRPDQWRLFPLNWPSAIEIPAVRSQRVRPATDDKILTAWNGLMLAAFAEASRVLSDDEPPRTCKETASSINNRYYLLATRNADFLLTHLCQMVNCIAHGGMAGLRTKSSSKITPRSSSDCWNSIKPISITNGSLPRSNWRRR